MKEFYLTGNPNRSNRGSAIGPPRGAYHSTCKKRTDGNDVLSIGFVELITSQNTIFLTF